MKIIYLAGQPAGRYTIRSESCKKWGGADVRYIQ
nr:MAG TPA: hypothetical protein [Caudoviricetes sp.]